MKLTELQIHACTGDDNPALQHDGKRCYFPHIHVGDVNTCARPRFYYPAGADPHWTGKPDYDPKDLQPAMRNSITINEVGWHNHGGQAPFDALAQLFAAAPQLLAIAERMVTQFEDPLARGGLKLMVDLRDLVREAQPLVRSLMALDLPEASQEGWGPYFNKDGTPYEETP